MAWFRFFLPALAADHFVENFDTFTNASYLTGALVLSSGTWTGLSVLGETASASRGGTGRAVRINDDTAGAQLATPALDTVGTVSFYWRELNAGGGTFRVQKSVAGGAYTDVGTLVYTGTTFTLYSTNVNDSSSAIRIRILNDNQYGHLIIDDMTVTDYSAGSTNTPPALNAIGAKSVGVGSNLQFNVTATPTDGDTVTLTASNLPAGAAFFPTNEAASFLWTNAAPTGTYSVTFNAADNDGSDEETITITVSPAGAQSPPALNAIGAKSVGVGSNLQFNVTATPTDGDTVTLTASNLPAGAAFFPTNEAASFLWTNASPTGTYSVTFNAADNDGSDAEAVTITVNPAAGGGGSALDLGSYSLIQSNGPQTYTFASGVSVDPNGYVIVARSASQAQFESAWGVTLGTNVVFLTSAGGTMPQINGGESYTLLNASGTLVDGSTLTNLNPLYNTIQRTHLGGAASDATNWSSSAMASATPGTGASGNGTAGLRISEYSDASNFSNEFIELYYDAASSLPTNQPPVLAAIGNQVTEETVLLQFAVSATDPADDDPITLTVSNAPVGSSFSSTNGNGTFTWALPTPDGVYTMSFYAADNDGADFETITITVNPPSASVTSNLWDFEDGWQNWTNYSRASADNWSRANFTGAESTAWKMEMEGLSSDDWLISPALNLTAVTDPILTYWTKRENRGNDITVKISTNYPGTGDPLAAGVSWADLAYSRPADQNVWAKHTNNLTAYVGQDQVYIAFYYVSSTRATRWSVDQIRYSATAAAESNAPPILAPIGDKSLTISNNLMFPVQAVDIVDDDPITLTASNLPAGAEFSATNGYGDFVWLGAAPDGVYTSTFYAADKDGSDSETIVITVSLPPGPTNLPVLASIGNKSIIRSNTLNFAVSATDLDGDAITLTASNLPAGAAFFPTNGAGSFLWTNASPTGNYSVTFNAADNDGADAETISIYVNPPAPTGTIYFQGFDGSINDTWGFSGSGSTLAAAARTGGYGRRIGGTDSLTFSNVDLTGHSYVMLNIHCASTGGVENFDALQVFVALDGGAFPAEPDITVEEGNPTDAVANLTWIYSGIGVAHTTAGTPATFNGDGTEGYATIRVRIPDGSSSVSVKIAADNSSTSEYYYVDDVEITSGTWQFHDPPVLAAVGSREGAQGASLIFAVGATDPDDDAVSLVASNLPDGAVFVDHGNGSGEFNWAYPAVTGSWATTFHAYNEDGSDSEQIAVFIDPAASSSNVSFTVMAANLSSGTDQAYHEPGIRIFQGLKPDIACLQEFNYASGARALVDTAFGTEFSYYVETDGEAIPNGIVSKYPILSSGQWVDAEISNRDFAWAQIDIPGTQDLYVVSVHLKADSSSASIRNTEAVALKTYITNNWPANAFIAICGDFNTYSRTESCISTLAAVVSDAIQPADQNSDKETNSARDNPYDRVLTSTNLNAKHTATVLGGITFANGLVFDSRVWSTPPDPVLSSDSGEDGMQHMGVMKTFQLEQASVPATSAVIYVLAGPNGSISPTNSTVNFGQNKTFTIAAATNYTIADVQVDGASIGTTNAYTFTNVTNHHSIAATFLYNGLSITVIDLVGPDSGSSEENAAAGISISRTNLNATITAGATQFLLTGWTRTGSSPASGASNMTGQFTMTTNTTVTWLWSTSYWFNSEAGAGGSVNAADRWAALGSNVTITATPSNYYNFSAWSGDAPSGEETNATITVAMNGPRQVTATFAARLATNDVPEWWLAQYGWTADFDDAAMGDPDGDTALTWQEYVAETIPTNKGSVFQVDARRAAAAGYAVLAWPSAAGRTYDVDYRTNAASGNWEQYQTNIAAIAPLNVYTGAMGADRLFFRVRVRRP
ncbi:MAG TPA: hypothetical protein P5567_15335 [Kiritimatiellia bacterium]|nr:hypothetical protein [Kiritimatiellia bacterium]HSA19436.1 hypothetical protein [Kiritimatiellia bacterium]